MFEINFNTLLFTRNLSNKNSSCNSVDPNFGDISNNIDAFDIAVISVNFLVLFIVIIYALIQLFRTRNEEELFLPFLCLLNFIPVLTPESNRVVQIIMFLACTPILIEQMKGICTKVDKNKHENHYALKHIHKKVEKTVLLYLMKFGVVQTGFIRCTSLLIELLLIQGNDSTKTLRYESIRLPLFFLLVNICTTTPAMVCLNVLRQISQTNILIKTQIWGFAVFVEYSLFDYCSQIFPNACNGMHSSFSFMMAIYRSSLSIQLFLIVIVSFYWSTTRKRHVNVSQTLKS